MAAETYKMSASAVIVTILLFVLLVGGGLVGCPYYKVWERKMAGQAELQYQQGARQALIAQAAAEVDGAGGISLGDDVADSHARRQAAVGVLKDDLDALAMGPQRAAGEMRDVGPGEGDDQPDVPDDVRQDVPEADPQVEDDEEQPGHSERVGRGGEHRAKRGAQQQRAACSQAGG